MSYQYQKRLDDAYVMHTYGRLPVEFVRGEGMELFDDSGRAYRDFLAGIGVCSLGHNHPAVTQALTEQATKLTSVSNYFYTEHRGEVAALLSKLANDDLDGARALVAALDAADEDAFDAAASPKPGEQVWETFFCQLGCRGQRGRHEARPASLRVGRATAETPSSASRAASMAARSRPLRRRCRIGCRKALRRCRAGSSRASPMTSRSCGRSSTGTVRRFARSCSSPSRARAASTPLTPEFLRAADELVHGVGGLTISDEVQAGVFRCGAPFAVQLTGVTPDIMSLAKGIAGGMTMGAVVARAEVADVFRPGDHGSTFGGSALAVAAAEAVLSELVRGDYAAHAASVGAYLASRLEELPQVTEVRGAGLMRGCDLVEKAGDAHDVVARLMAEGVIANATGARTLRFLPPLICEREDVDVLIAALQRVLG